MWTGVGLFIRRFAMVSTGWKPKSSRTPAKAEPANLAVRRPSLEEEVVGDDGLMCARGTKGSTSVVERIASCVSDSVICCAVVPSQAD